MERKVGELARRFWVAPLLIFMLVWFVVIPFLNRPVSMSDEKALELTMKETRADGLTYRAFVETRFRKERCQGKDPGPIDFRVVRTEGIYEFISIQAAAWDSDGRCPEPFAMIAGIPLARSWDTSDYPMYRGRLGKVTPASTGRDKSAEPRWLEDFRNGRQP